MHPSRMVLKALLVIDVQLKWDVDKEHGPNRKEPRLEMGLKILWHAALKRQRRLPEDNYRKAPCIAVCILWRNITTSDPCW